jgi:hypothetical protein
MDGKLRNRPTMFMNSVRPNLPFSNSKFGHKSEVKICPVIQPKYYLEFYPYLEF